MQRIRDVVVVGAGPGGCSTAYFLAKQGIDVLLLDKAVFPREKTCGDGLTPRAIKVLEEMGVLPAVEEQSYRINGLEVVAPRGGALRAPVPEKEDYPNYLLIAQRLLFDHILLKHVVTNGVEFQAPFQVFNLGSDRRSIELVGTSRGKRMSLQARVVVLAVGSNMQLLLRLGYLRTIPQIAYAARGYYTNLQGMDDHVHAYFEGIPLPGYGWVFPFNENSANIGVGYWQKSGFSRLNSGNAVRVLKRFKASRYLSAVLRDAQLIAPLRSYPIRCDFVSAPTYSDRILFVGEAAGLGNPLTGEGIDFALESGRLAAQFLVERFHHGDFSLQSIREYDRVLRERFQRLFRFLTYVRQLYINPLVVDLAIKAGRQNLDVKEVLMNVLLGHQDAADMVNFSVLSKVFMALFQP